MEIRIATARVFTVAGAGLLGLGAFDIYRTILHSHGRSGPVTEMFTRTVWRLARAVALRCRRPTRHQLLKIASLLLPGIVAALVTLIILGFALLYWPHLPQSFSFQEKAQALAVSRLSISAASPSRR